MYKNFKEIPINPKMKSASTGGYNVSEEDLNYCYAGDRESYTCKESAAYRIEEGKKAVDLVGGAEGAFYRSANLIQHVEEAMEFKDRSTFTRHPTARQMHVEIATPWRKNKLTASTFVNLLRMGLKYTGNLDTFLNGKATMAISDDSSHYRTSIKLIKTIVQQKGFDFIYEINDDYKGWLLVDTADDIGDELESFLDESAKKVDIKTIKIMVKSRYGDSYELPTRRAYYKTVRGKEVLTVVVDENDY